jgi:Fis family transcriptional regulator
MSAQVIEYNPSPTPTRERRKQPLGNAVRVALKLYFERLEGQRPDELYNMVMDEVERPLLECTMEYCGGNQTKAARFLGLNRGTLRKKLKHHGLD